MADLYLMMGVPGSGKSTFLKQYVNKKNSIIISRDEIRFSLLKEGEQYFSHEKEVLKIFWQRINTSLAENKNVFVDQTSLTPNSRKYLLNHVKGYTYANLIWINEPLEVCLERNELRKNTKAYVPVDVIINMNNQLIPPSLEEGFKKIFIYNSKEKKNKNI